MLPPGTKGKGPKRSQSRPARDLEKVNFSSCSSWVPKGPLISLTNPRILALCSCLHPSPCLPHSLMGGSRWLGCGPVLLARQIYTFIPEQISPVKCRASFTAWTESAEIFIRRAKMLWFSRRIFLNFLVRVCYSIREKKKKKKAMFSKDKEEKVNVLRYHSWEK